MWSTMASREMISVPRCVATERYCKRRKTTKMVLSEMCLTLTLTLNPNPNPNPNPNQDPNPNPNLQEAEDDEDGVKRDVPRVRDVQRHGQRL